MSRGKDKPKPYLMEKQTNTLEYFMTEEMVVEAVRQYIQNHVTIPDQFKDTVPRIQVWDAGSGDMNEPAIINAAATWYKESTANL